MAQMATEKRAKIIQNLLRSIKLRLLHPGAFTELIIEFYLMAAQALYCLGMDFVILVESRFSRFHPTKRPIRCLHVDYLRADT